MGENYKFTFIEYNLSSGHASYLIRVQGPNNITFNIQDRYSQMLQLIEQLQQDKELSSGKDLPKFPKKKLFGSKKPAFLAQRKEQLQQFFNVFFMMPAVLKQ